MMGRTQVNLSKIISILFFSVLLIASLTACNGSGQQAAADPPEGTETSGSSPESASAAPAEAATESVPEGPELDTEFEGGEEDPPWWNGLDLGPNVAYAEEYETGGESGNYMNTAEAAGVTFDRMKANGNIPEYSDDTDYTMTLVGIEDIEGEDCYVYRLDVDEPTGTIGAAYAYAYDTGTIYMQGYGGQWVIPEGADSVMSGAEAADTDSSGE